MKNTWIISVISAIGFMAPLAQAHDSSAVLNEIHHINQKEIQLSNLALEKSTSEDIKKFARHMIDQHTAADKKVQALAGTEGVELTAFQLADFEKVGSDHLKSLTGGDFDRAFAGMMKGGHKEALFVLDAVKDETKDKELKDLVRELRPTVKEHEKMASNLTSKVKGEK